MHALSRFVRTKATHFRQATRTLDWAERPDLLSMETAIENCAINRLLTDGQLGRCIQVWAALGFRAAVADARGGSCHDAFRRWVLPLGKLSVYP